MASLTISDFDATEFDSIVAAIVTKFGKPKQSQSGVSTSAMGAKFDNRRLTWLGKGWQLQMDKRSNSVLKSSLVYATAKAVRKFGESSAAKKDDI